MNTEHTEVSMTYAVNDLIDNIAANYRTWCNDMTDPEAEVRKFRAGISTSKGPKYIRIIKDGSVWGFVVNVANDKKFKYGDILKAKSWKGPERNFARGNVFGEYQAPWTSAS